MAKIINIKAREILDSRGNPTVEVEIYLDNGISSRASVPSGASTGVHEALELRDDDIKRYKGKGVLKAVENVNKIIAPKIIGTEVYRQRDIDKLLCELDGTENKGKLGANAILAVSLSCAKAGAISCGLPLYKYIGGVNSYILPVPFMNILNGGLHSDNTLDVQEFMIVPKNAPSLKEAVRWGAEVFHSLKSILKKDNLNTAVGDEGGFAPNIATTEDAIKYIIKAIEEADYKPGKEIFLALDSAASSFYEEGKYNFEKRKRKSLDMIKIYEDLVERFPIISLEDPLAEDDWDGWITITEKLGKKIQIVGDDLFVTNVKRLKQGVEKKAANCILIKVNQIGTLTEALETIELAKINSYKIIISHRSGETEDTTISDIAVATNSGQIKTGSLSRTERIAKYNQLIRIEEELGDEGKYAKD